MVRSCPAVAVGKMMGSKNILGSVGQECGPAVGTGVERMMVFPHL